MDKHTALAERIADAINANCDAHLRGEIDRNIWSDEQNRLWALAAQHFIASDVMRLICPSLNAPVPPYSVRKQLREQTLKVGR